MSISKHCDNLSMFPQLEPYAYSTIAAHNMYTVYVTISAK